MHRQATQLSMSRRRSQVFVLEIVASSVAHRAVGQTIDLDFVTLHEFTPFLKLFLRRQDEVHAEDVALVAKMALRVAMTLQAPFHGHRLFLPRQGHLVDPAMARHASHSLSEREWRG